MKPIVKVPLKYGAIGGGMIILMFVVFYLASTNPLVEMKMFDFYILPVFIFFGIKEFRDSHNQQVLEFWQGMTTGFLIYISLAALVSLFIWFFVQFIDVSLLVSYIANGLNELDQKKVAIIKKMGEETYTISRSEVRGTTVFDVALDSFIKKSAIGLMLTIMISVIMRRKV